MTLTMTTSDTAETMQCPPVSKTGLTRLFDNASEDSKNVDYVFIHGLNGHPKNTWTNPSTGFFWPWELNGKLKHSRVFTFGYNADLDATTQNFIRIKGIAASLLGDLANERTSSEELDRPIVFVAHSLGGLVAKYAAVEANANQATQADDLDRLSKAVKGFVFFGVPHGGSRVYQQKRVQIIKIMAQVVYKEIPPKLDTALQSGSDELLDLADSFRKLPAYVNNELAIITFFESLATPKLGRRVVDEDSASLHYAKATQPVPIAADHVNMVKFLDRDDSTFGSIQKRLMRLETRLMETNTQQASHEAPKQSPGKSSIVDLYRLNNLLVYSHNTEFEATILKAISQLSNNLLDKTAPNAPDQPPQANNSQVPTPVRSPLIHEVSGEEEIDQENKFTLQGLVPTHAGNYGTSNRLHKSFEAGTDHTRLSGSGEAEQDIGGLKGSTAGDDHLNFVALHSSKSILSFDSGGVKSLSSLRILDELMRRMAQEMDVTELLPCRVFDLIGGSGTGGVIAILLGRFRLSTSQTIKIFNDLILNGLKASDTLSNRMLALIKGGAMFSNKELEEMIRALVHEHIGDVDAQFQENTEDSMSTCCVTVCNTSGDISCLTSSSNLPKNGPAITFPHSLVDVLMACVAYPAYFDPITSHGNTYFSGAISAANPCLLLLEEAKRLWKIDPDDLACCVSIGSGKTARLRFDAGANMVKLVNLLAQTAQDPSAVADRVANIFRGISDGEESNQYFRFEVDQGLENVHFMDRSALDIVTDLTLTYMTTTTLEMRRCVENLSERFISEVIQRINEDSRWDGRFKFLLSVRKKKIEQRLARLNATRQRLTDEQERLQNMLNKI